MSLDVLPLPKTGFFHIGTNAISGPLVTAHLTVTGDTVTGVADFSQPVSPPIRFCNDMKGSVHTIVFGKDVHQVYSLQGLQAAGSAYWISSMVITLDGIWGTKGTASYTYITPDKKHVSVESQPVTVTWPLPLTRSGSRRATLGASTMTQNLTFIKTSNTPNGHVEVHVASAASNYQTRTLETPTTFGNEDDGTWQMLANNDLAFIKTNNTGTGTVEVHIASAASNYQTRTVETGTTFAPDPAKNGTWQMLANNDLVAAPRTTSL